MTDPELELMYQRMADRVIQKRESRPAATVEARIQAALSGEWQSARVICKRIAGNYHTVGTHLSIARETLNRRRVAIGKSWHYEYRRVS